MSIKIRQGYTISSTLFNYVFDLIFRAAMQDYLAIQVSARVQVFVFAYAGDIVVLFNNNRRRRSLLAGVGSHAATVGIRINVLYVSTDP